MRRAPRAVQALALTAALAAAPGCRALGRDAQGFYEVSAGAFIQNPATFVPFHLGLGVGILVGAPLLLLSWPLAALFGPPFEGGYGIASRVAPALALGTLTGDVLSAPFWVFGLPFEPDAPAARGDRRPDRAPEGGLASEPEDG